MYSNQLVQPQQQGHLELSPFWMMIDRWRVHAGAGVSGEGGRGAGEGEQVLRVAGVRAAGARRGAHRAAPHPRRRQAHPRRPLRPPRPVPPRAVRHDAAAAVALAVPERVERPAPALLRPVLAAVHVR
jgi:hypothetical protein